ncbi:hypothetical protein DSM106972_002690 [Dulcicalothrix desertica PCC 7102]|uniref:DUF4351 domain-containing protein n=1 Tax=Dulcicalothrix desertica PCC 7102 TaxID=232991 RepID=A0A433VUI9_9CYAN|nr:DUF4351 domain-containing protein [Dulcicalothrix desertica]RUT09774.1 hypothetical protein DSM106972_002690 [Dulcicalothrix desertica PCC 7102]
MEIVTSWMEKGIEKGIKLGREEGFKIGWEEGFKLGMEEGIELGRQSAVASFVLHLLQHRFGNLSQIQQERIQGLSRKRLEELGEALLDFNSITDLKNWLARI